MKILGLKLTHDAAIALLDGPELIFSVEVEKINNNPRYTKMPSLDIIEEVLRREAGMNLEEVDYVVIDGWKHSVVTAEGLPSFPSASYHDGDDHWAQGVSLLQRTIIPFADPEATRFKRKAYISYKHMAGHVVGSYVASPLAEDREPAFVLTWDGGQNARVHYVDPRSTSKIVRWRGNPIHVLYGMVYSIMRYYFGPYKEPAVAALDYRYSEYGPLFGGYDTPGKLMSYLGMGSVNPTLKSMIWSMYIRLEKEVLTKYGMDIDGFHGDGEPEHRFMKSIAACVREGFPVAGDEVVVATFQAFLEELLVTRLKAAIPPGSNLIFTGGSALNIKWNTAIRDCGHFNSVWVPPFANDSGAALGTAACEMVRTSGWRLHWNPYSGPSLKDCGKPNGWTGSRSSPEKLGRTLAEDDRRAVIVLNGRAELGPRALGHRSILMSARDLRNKDFLNAAKGREVFRPVAPMCMEPWAPHIFDPGTTDRFMLFDHVVREEWRKKIPAVVHLDNTARLQTVGRTDDDFTYRVLAEYYMMTGIPVLCNTSANLAGRGFFDDLYTACQWAEKVGIRHVYYDGWMYTPEER